MTGLVKVKLDKERNLRLCLKGMLEFERLTGRNLLKGFNTKDMTLKDTAALLWACLLHEDKELTFDDVLLMVDFKNLPDVVNALNECLQNSLPVVDESPLAVKSPNG